METNPERMKTQRENCVKCPHACVISSPTVFEVNLAYFTKLEALLSGFPQAKKGLSPCLGNPSTVVVLCLFKNSSHCSMGLQDARILVPFFLPRPVLLKHLKPTGRMYYVYNTHTPTDRRVTILKENQTTLHVHLPKGTRLSLRTQHGSFNRCPQHPPSWLPRWRTELRVVNISDPEIHLGTHS